MPRRVYDHLRAGEGDILIVADHASNTIPPEFNGLGLTHDALEAHIAWDIGTAALGHALSARLGCEAILSNVSRLVVDKNRRIDQPGLIPDISDGIAIPGNTELTDSAVNARLEDFYHPYHAAIEAAVASKTAPMLISLHSFTPHMDGRQRPWQCGLLYNQDDRLARKAISFFAQFDLCVGDNQPYPGNIYNATMDRHAEAAGHPYLMLEIRNDLLATDKDVAWWSAKVADFIAQL